MVVLREVFLWTFRRPSIPLIITCYCKNWWTSVSPPLPPSGFDCTSQTGHKSHQLESTLSPTEMPFGVTQRCILGPLLFFICQRPFRLLLLFPFLSLGLYLLAIFSLAMCFSKLVAWRRLKHFSLFLFEALNSLYVLKCKNLAENVWQFLSWFPGTFIDLVTLTIGTPDLSDEKKESLKEIIKPSVTAYMKYHKPSTLLDFDNFFGHMTKIYRTALVSVKISSLVILVKCPTLESLERLWKDYQSGCLNGIAERFLVTDELKRKLGLDNIRLKTTIEEENYLICKRAFLENSG